MRIAVGKGFGPQAHLAEQLARQRARGAVSHAVNFWTERDRFLDGEAWVQRGIAVLKHHLHAAAQFAQRQRAADLHAVIDDVAGIALHQVHQQPCGGRLAAAGFADDADGFALGDGEGDIIDRAHGLAGAEQIAAHRKMLCEASHLQQRLRRAADVLDRLQ